ncbi:MAG TPA: hydroxyacid dehydrogenase [Ktedonobacteraceae bacterium]|nr:hydroxyacid dehydrogenase [Ktedonobacteraceae bacterium]
MKEKLPKVAVLLAPAMREQMLAPEALEQLARFATVVVSQEATLEASALAELLDGAVACLTGWGTPPLSDELIAGLPSLRLVAHTAGSIRRLVSLSAIEHGLQVSHAAAIIADSVAELVISQAILCLRHLHEIDREMKAGGEWGSIRQEYPGRLLGSRCVGVVGAGRVGRAVIRLFKAFSCRVLAYDPYLTADEAEHLGIEVVGLDDLLAQADVVTLHAPVLPETEGMIGAAQLARLRDGAIFINAARAALVDEEALFQELSRGRIVAALDVFAKEPLPIDSRFRSLPNVILSPHTAGHTVDTHLRQGQAMVDEVQRLLSGEPLWYRVTAFLYDQLA